MENRERPQKKRSNILWLLVILVVIVVWFLIRPAPDGDAAVTAADRQAAMAFSDPDDILVDFFDDTTDAQIAAVERATGIDLVLVSDQSRDERFYRAHVAASARDAILAKLAREPAVDIAEPDAQVAAAPVAPILAPDTDATWKDFPNDPKYKYQWHLRQIHMPEAWKLADGDGVIVAVLDTGVAYEDYQRFHRVPDLAGVKFVKPFDFVANDAHANDDHGHGTHVTGTIAQTTHNGIGVAGIARAVQIMPLKVLAANGTGSVAAIADAIRYAADNGAKVINMSLGGRFPSKILERAVTYAHKKGVTVVCAAGNAGRGKVGYPAAYDDAVAVAATQYDETTTFYSNWGKALDISAPGGNTRVDQNNDGMPDGVLQNTIAIGNPEVDDYYAYMGTSMASPHAAGVAALIVGEGVTNPDRVEKILEDTAHKPESYNKGHYGAGIIDASAAVTAARKADGGLKLLLGAVLALAICVPLRRRGARMGAGLVAGTVMGASGLFALPAILPSISSWPVIETLTRGLPSWDLAVFGPAGHGNPLFFSALIPLALVAVGFGIKRARGFLAGLSIGCAAHLLYFAAAGTLDIAFIPSAFGLETVWLLANAALAAILARLALTE